MLGMSNWMSNEQLWKIKTGKAEPDNIDNPFVNYGNAAEPLLRELFKLDFADVYGVDYSEYKIVRNSEHAFIFATPDGELTELETGRKGVLEIKTAEIMNSRQWSDWDNRIPDAYYIQVCWQLLATGYDFAVLKAQIKHRKGGELNIATRHYKIERQDVLEDIALLMQEGIEFWAHVEGKTQPPLKLPPI